MLWVRAELLSPVGSGLLVGGISMVAAFYRFVPQGLFLNTYKDVHQAYRRMQPVELPADVTASIDHVLHCMNFNTASGGLLRYFCSSISEPWHAGCCKLRWGAVVGVPLSYCYTSEQQLAASDFAVHGRRVNWQSEAGQRLASSLLLSPSARQFAIARETLCVQRPYMMEDGALTSAACFITYMTGVAVKVRGRLVHLPRLYRAAIYCGVGVLGAMGYTAVKDAILRRRDADVDRTVANLGVDFARGGVEFYEKLLRRNSAARMMEEECGESTSYSTLGDVMYLFRVRRLPLTERMARLKAQLREMQEMQSDSTASGSDGLADDASSSGGVS